MPLQDEQERMQRAAKALRTAAMKGELATVRALLSAHPDWDLARRFDRSGHTALILAASFGRLECVIELMPFSDVDARTFDGRSALTQAAGKKREDCLKALLRVCDPTVRGPSRRTALMLAAMAGAVESVRLLRPVSQMDARDGHKQNALMLAVDMGRIESLLELLKDCEKTGSDPRRTRLGESALMIAVKKKQTHCARVLLEHNAQWALDTDKHGLSAFLHAAKRGDAEMLRTLWSHSDRQATDDEGRSALAWALQESHWACAEWLAPELPMEADAELQANGPKNLPGWAAQRERDQLEQAIQESGGAAPSLKDKPKSQKTRSSRL